MLGSQGSRTRTRHGHALGSLLHGVLRVHVCGRIHRQVNSRGGPGDMPFSPGCGSGQPHQPLHGASAPEPEQDRPLQAWSRHLPLPHRRCPMPSGGYFGLLRHTPSHSQAILRFQRRLSTDQGQTGGRSVECPVPCRGRHGSLLGTQLPGGCCHHGSSCRPQSGHDQDAGPLGIFGIRTVHPNTEREPGCHFQTVVKGIVSC